MVRYTSPAHLSENSGRQDFKDVWMKRKSVVNQGEKASSPSSQNNSQRSSLSNDKHWAPSFMHRGAKKTTW
jgi:hypothetical protein